MGRPMSRVLLYPITVYFLLTAPGARRASRQFLRRVLPHEPTHLDVARHFHSFASVILDRVYFITNQHDQFDIRISNEQLLFDILKSGRGCVLLGAHLGSFEVLRTLALSKFQLPLKVLMYKQHNEIITRLLEALNPEIGNTVINLGDPDVLLVVNDHIQQGGIVGILADRVAESDKVSRCQFLGQEVVLPAGPVLVAGALQVPVIVFCGLYRGGNRYEIYFDLLGDKVTIDRSRRDQEAQRWMQLYADRLEHYVRLAPYNWFNFFDYWNVD